MYSTRDERSEYCAKKYEEYLKGNVLDVGCWEKDLQKYLPVNVNYTGIDIAGDYDIQVDLEKGEIPFADNKFDCVVCTDVLEHLDSLHKVFSELVRVTDKYVIVSLPNNWVPLKKPLLSGGGKLKQYGLSAVKPIDRHKWFFNFEDAETFFTERQSIDGYVIESCLAYPDFSMLKKKKFIKKVIKKVIGSSRYNNLFSSTIWVVLRKQENNVTG